MTLPEDVHASFEDMYSQMTTEHARTAQGFIWLQHALTVKQRDWVQRTVNDHVPQYENLYSSGKIPRGREVTVNTGPLPKRPPSRR